MRYSLLPWGEGRLRPSLESDLIATIVIIAITPIIAIIDTIPPPPSPRGQPRSNVPAVPSFSSMINCQGTISLRPATPLAVSAGKVRAFSSSVASHSP